MDTHDDIVNSQTAAAAGGADAQRPTGGGGAEPSNTAPHNYIPLNLKVLRVGVDSLYLSARGKLYEPWNNKLVALKELAQSDEPAQRAQAQLKIGGHLFEVKDRGSRFYAFVLEDGLFHIQLGKGETLPLAYVQVRAEYLAYADLSTILQDLTGILNTLSKVQGGLIVSRADLCIDFVPPCPMDGWAPRAWVTRARDIDPHYRNQKLTGWSIGKGSHMSGRLYNKLLEIVQKSGSVYFFELWKAKGWTGEEDVWRLEAQFRREVLEQLSVRSPESLADKLQGLWGYFTEDWLRLCIPNDTDHNPTRWPLHPFWILASGVSWGQGDQPKLKRLRKQRLPPAERLCRMVAGCLASFMAREQIDDYSEGLGELLRQMRGFGDIDGQRFGKNFEQLLDAKRREKGKRYNTIDNTRIDPKKVREERDAHLRAQDGEDGIL